MTVQEELDAIAALVALLEPMTPEERQRVLAYLMARYTERRHERERQG